VNNGNRDVTGHWWDMRTCPEEAGHTHGHDDEAGDEHDKTQIFPDRRVSGDGEGVDALAGRVLDRVRRRDEAGSSLPLYGPAPLQQPRPHRPRRAPRPRDDRQGHGLRPRPHERLRQRERSTSSSTRSSPPSWRPPKEGRAPVLPGGAVQPQLGQREHLPADLRAERRRRARTGDAATFVQRWQKLRGYAAAQAPAGYDFGMG
jgi:hypothetical protein